MLACQRVLRKCCWLTAPPCPQLAAVTGDRGSAGHPVSTALPDGDRRRRGPWPAYHGPEWKLFEERGEVLAAACILGRRLYSWIPAPCLPNTTLSSCRPHSLPLQDARGEGRLLVASSPHINSSSAHQTPQKASTSHQQVIYGSREPPLFSVG